MQDRKAKSQKIRLKRGVAFDAGLTTVCTTALFMTCYKFDLIRTTVIFMAIGGKHERQQEGAQIIE